jgi:hypothetical protein
VKKDNYTFTITEKFMNNSDSVKQGYKLLAEYAVENMFVNMDNNTTATAIGK